MCQKTLNAIVSHDACQRTCQHRIELSLLWLSECQREENLRHHNAHITENRTHHCRLVRCHHSSMYTSFYGQACWLFWLLSGSWLVRLSGMLWISWLMQRYFSTDDHGPSLKERQSCTFWFLVHSYSQLLHFSSRTVEIWSPTRKISELEVPWVKKLMYLQCEVLDWF